jgi:acyl-CoA synthetase (AMP-forming)/AMP-acid ligase II
MSTVSSAANPTFSKASFVRIRTSAGVGARATLFIMIEPMDTTSIVQRFKTLQKETAKGVRFVDAKAQIKQYTYAQLMESGSRFAKALSDRKIQSAVILVMVNPESAIIAILGCMMAGCPPTPVYPPQNVQAVPAFLRFIKHVAARSGATLIVAEGEPYSLLGSVPHDTKTVYSVEKFDSMFSNSTGRFDRQVEQSTAFLQFTSGSTADPKGVIVSHRALAANLWMIRTASHMTESSCVVTWLPVYHDMGLIGTVLNAITLPCDLVVLPPMVFLKKPRLWLELITQFLGTHTAAPNFAYGICARRVADINGLKLSTMTTFICGAEPVIPLTLERFAHHFTPAGLNPASLVPAYGLAEATLAVTFTPYLRGLISDRIDLDALSTANIAMPAEAGNAHSMKIASCGASMPEMSVRIANENEMVLQQRQVGEIQVKGPSVTEGYIGDEVATRESRTSDGWLRTGDLGYMVNDELYVCGRSKDVIIIRGKNFHAHDLEHLASEVPDIRTGNVVAFSSRNESGESLVVIAESRNENESAILAKNVRNHLSESIGISPDEVVIVPAGTLPKTSSGKLKRSETKRLYETGSLQKKPIKAKAYFEIVKSFFRL